MTKINRSVLSSVNFIIKMIGILMPVLVLTACSQQPKITYNPDDFVNPNRIVEKTMPEPQVTSQVDATFGVGNDPAVMRAYKKFVQRGVIQNISAAGFKTFGYSAYAHPIIACAPLHLCIVQLEQGEKINNIDLGDSAHWLTATALIGDANQGSYQIVLKPKLYDIATDMVITTNKRTYNIGLVSERGATTHVANFYYPEETLQQTLAKTHQEMNSPLQQAMVTQEPDININHLNFNYILSGDYPAWRPVRVFDDGMKTFIQMPPISERLDLPVLYLVKQGTMTLVNYRYRRPYYVIDALFQTAYLVSGKGSSQVRVEIRNRNFS